MKIVRCSKANYWDHLECLPPSFAAFGERGGIVAFTVGEPWDHNSAGIPLFSGYLMLGDRHFRTSEPVTAGEYAAYLIAKLGVKLQRWGWEG